MKKHGILNSDISSVLSYMGHTDRIAIADCGLPIPEETMRIDLALEFGKPSFMEVLKAVSKDMKVEAVVLAEEIEIQNPEILEQIKVLLEEMGSEISITFVPHEELKEQTKNCKAVVRTGETTPYANIILQSGCIFG